ncbi:Major Facilitator Superfamily protein [Geodermatophilus obscurus]|uniref:Major Facilitator Superfamily protein n=1 Tax=Geodermatophilus obscurus TaxID=1861 RepID=A0A1M7V090_9ACTN|nr:MFS transporter [Geodermatophilus obscurus]SHN88638.1 Major Facilitator Superfamily protein [Geodermatophilus obscurus]
MRSLLARGDFRRLLATRLSAQFGDGVLQAALAGTVLFNPQRAADPVEVAAAFAVLLLPYSLVGPFAGVWLDRWSRRQVLVHADLLRAGLVAVLALLVAGGSAGAPFLLTGLALFSVARFVLSALSAALPHTAPDLVPANALSTTSGAVATVAGGAVAVALQQAAGTTGDAGYAALVLGAAVPYLLAAALAAGFPRGALGPDEGAARPSARQVVAGVVAGARHVRARPPAGTALALITVHRLCFGLVTLVTLLFFRGASPSGEGLLGAGMALAAGACGTLLAAAGTPAAVRRLGTARWVTLLLGVGGLLLAGLGLPFLPATVVLTGAVLGFLGQGVKICVDATLQQVVDDDVRGRVFSVYDMLVNVSYVAALVAAAHLLPADGISPPAMVAVGAAYVLAALYAARSPLPR